MSFSKNRGCDGCARLHRLHVCTMLTGTWRHSMAPRQRGRPSADTRGLTSLCVAARPGPDGNRFAIGAQSWKKGRTRLSRVETPQRPGLEVAARSKNRSTRRRQQPVLLRWLWTSRGAVFRCLLGRAPLLVPFLGIRTLPCCTLSRTAVRRRGGRREEVSVCALI